MRRRNVLFVLPALALLYLAASGNPAPDCVPIDPVEPQCVEVDPYAFGPCAMVIGWVFDGEQCVLASGCDCGDACASVYETEGECREACGLPTGLQEGDVCGVDHGECAEGLVCCYPCGVAGCDDVCTVPCDSSEPWCVGGCPMYP